MAASRALPRKPVWLEPTPPLASVDAQGAARLGTDTTARVLEFPATAPRRQQPTAAAAAHPPGTNLSLLPSTALASHCGSTLRPEPAYRSALDRLTLRPTSAASATSSSHRSLPSSRFDDLLAGRPSTAAAPPAAAPPARSSRLDALLAARPTAATATAAPAPLPSSRLDALLAGRPSTAVAAVPATPQQPSSAAQPRLPSSRLDELLSRPARPASSAVAAKATADPAGALGSSSKEQPEAGMLARSAVAPRPLPASVGALSPVVEEKHTSSTRRPATALPNAAAATSPRGRPPSSAPQQPVGAAAAAGVVVPVGKACGLDPGLQERLRERTEVAKVQIRQQLGPMFRISEALLGAELDPERAADALDAATGVAANGFERLAMRPGSRGGAGSAAGWASSQATTEAPNVVGRQGMFVPTGASGGGLSAAAASQLGEDGQRLQQQSRQESRAASVQRHGADGVRSPQRARAGAFEAHDALSAGEVDSLVANARAAAARAQSALADMASPPRQQRTTPCTAQQRSTCGTPPAQPEAASAASVPRAAAPLPYAQLAVSAYDSEAGAQTQQQLLVVSHAGEAGGADAWVSHLRQHTEQLIRSECERMVASVHSIFDGLLGSLQQQHLGAEAGRALLGSLHQQQPGADVQGLNPTSAAAGEGSGGSSAHADIDAGFSGRLHGASLSSSYAGSDHGGSSVGSDHGGSSGGSDAAPFDFSQPPPQQQLQQEQWPDGEEDEEEWAHAASSAGAPKEQSPEGWQQQQHTQQQQQQQRVQLQAGGYAGFGSPIRMHVSPAKAVAGSLLGRAAAAAAVHSPQQQQQRQQRPGLLGTSARSLSLGSSRLLAPAAEQVTPVFGVAAGSRAAAAGGRTGLQPAPDALSGYQTARSSAGPPSSGSSAASGDFFDSPPAGGSEAPTFGSSQQAAVAGSSSLARAAAAAAAHGEARQGSLLLGAGRKDLDSIVGSIRRLAAEMRLKQGVLGAPLPGSRAPHGAVTAAPDAGSSAARLATPTFGSGAGGSLLRGGPSGGSPQLYTALGGSSGARSGGTASPGVHRKPLR